MCGARELRLRRLWRWGSLIGLLSRVPCKLIGLISGVVSSFTGLFSDVLFLFAGLFSGFFPVVARPFTGLLVVITRLFAGALLVFIGPFGGVLLGFQFFRCSLELLLKGTEEFLDVVDSLCVHGDALGNVLFGRDEKAGSDHSDLLLVAA